MDLPIEQIIKALEAAGTKTEDIALAVGKMIAEHSGSAVTKTEEVAPKMIGRVAEVAPKLVAEGEALPAAEKISAAVSKVKTARPKFDDVVHAGEVTKFSDILSPEEYAKLSDKELKSISNRQAHAWQSEQRRLAGRAAAAEKKAANKAAHAETRTPEARRAAAAKQKAYFESVKKGDK